MTPRAFIASSSSPRRCSASLSSWSWARWVELGHQDLAALTGGAGDQGDAGALGGVLRHRRAGADRLVVGVGVHQQQPSVGGLAHGHDPRRRGRAAGRKGRSGSSQSTSSSSSGPSQRSSSWSWPGRGLPTATRQTATCRSVRGADRLGTVEPAIHDDAGSRAPPGSRGAARPSAVSPGSTLPPGTPSGPRPRAATYGGRRAAARPGRSRHRRRDPRLGPPAVETRRPGRAGIYLPRQATVRRVAERAATGAP